MTKCFSLLAFLALLSCDDRDAPAPQPQPETRIYVFKFDKFIKVHNIALYRGKNAVRETPATDYIAGYWSTYKTPAYESAKLDLEKDSLTLYAGKSSVAHKIMRKNDSLFVERYGAVGIFKPKDRHFLLFNSFSYILTKDPETKAESFSKTRNIGLTGDHKVFHDYSFTSPKEMNDGDKVFWANTEYFYKAD